MGVLFIKYGKDGTLYSKTLKSEYNAKVYPLVCDRLTLTCEVPYKIQELVKHNLIQDGAKPSKGYKLSKWIDGLPMNPPPYSHSEEDKLTSAYIQCDPQMSGVGFLRIDFNPAKLDVPVFKAIVNQNWLNIPGLNFNYILDNGKVTRFDLAVDISREQVGNLYYHYPKLQYTEVHTKSGRTEYLGGKTKVGKRVAIYDRIPALKASNLKKYYNSQYQVPLPGEDILRVEIRLFPKIPFGSMYAIKNPFQPMVVSSPGESDGKDQLWDLFLVLACFEGAQATLARLTKHKKKEFVARLKKSMPPWWRPGDIWEQFSHVLDSIKNA